MNLCYVGKNLSNLRIKNKCSQTYVSNMLHIDRSIISKYERGSLYPNVQILIKLATFYGVSIDYLLSDNDLVE